MNQLPLDMESLRLCDVNMEGEPEDQAESSESVSRRVLRKRMNTGLNLTLPKMSTSKRRCMQLPQKRETLAQIKKLYLNITNRALPRTNLETIFEESEEDKKVDGLIGQRKMRRTIIFSEGLANKGKMRHRTKMVKRLSGIPGHIPRANKRHRVSLQAVLDRLSDDFSTDASLTESSTSSQSNQDQLISCKVSKTDSCVDEL